MNKEEFIRRRGIAAYIRKVEQSKAWHDVHTTEDAETRKAYKGVFPEKVRECNRKWRLESKKGGKYYKRVSLYMQTGLRHERHKVRVKHATKWRKYKNIIAPGSQIHHEWTPGTADYRGVALVEADQHMHGIIKVIEVLDGNINLFTETEVRMK